MAKLNQEQLSRRAAQKAILSMVLLIQRQGANEFERDEARQIADLIRGKKNKK